MTKEKPVPIATITKRTGFGVSDTITFRLESIDPINIGLATIAQRQAGYPANAYGIFNFKSIRDTDSGGFIATWQCQASCD